MVTARLETVEAVAIERAQLSGRWPSMAEQDVELERRAGTRRAQEGEGGEGVAAAMTEAVRQERARITAAAGLQSSPRAFSW